MSKHRKQRVAVPLAPDLLMNGGIERGKASAVPIAAGSILEVAEEALN